MKNGSDEKEKYDNMGNEFSILMEYSWLQLAYSLAYLNILANTLQPLIIQTHKMVHFHSSSICL